MKFKKFSQLFALLVLIITIFTSCTKSNTEGMAKSWILQAMDQKFY